MKVNSGEVMTKNNKKEYYQKVINDLIAQHGESNFTYRLFGEALNFTKQRAKQLVDHYQLTIPTYDYLASGEYDDLKKLVESNEIYQHTLKSLYQDRYQKFLPKAFINEFVTSSGKSFLKLTDRSIFGNFFGSTETANKSKRELFAELEALHPDKNFKYTTFCSDLDKRGLPFRRIRAEFSGKKNIDARTRIKNINTKVENFIANHEGDVSLYTPNQLYVLYKEFAKNQKESVINYSEFRKGIVLCKICFARTMPIALKNRLKSLNINLSEHSLKELVAIHNNQYPLFPIVQKHLNNYGIRILLSST